MSLPILLSTDKDGNCVTCEEFTTQCDTCRGFPSPAATYACTMQFRYEACFPPTTPTGPQDRTFTAVLTRDSGTCAWRGTSDEKIWDCFEGGDLVDRYTFRANIGLFVIADGWLLESDWQIRVFSGPWTSFGALCGLTRVVATGLGPVGAYTPGAPACTLWEGGSGLGILSAAVS